MQRSGQVPLALIVWPPNVAEPDQGVGAVSALTVIGWVIGIVTRTRSRWVVSLISARLQPLPDCTAQTFTLLGSTPLTCSSWAFGPSVLANAAIPYSSGSALRPAEFAWIAEFGSRHADGS